MASYHLSVKTVQRSGGRSATAAIAYRAAERIECQREGRVHDYRAKTGVEASFILAPEGAPAWAQDRQALWNAAEARETRSNSVTAREWELALPHELDAQGRRLLVEGFARELVGRYGVAADVAIHAPHREGDQRNWHAHVLTTTRSVTAEGLTDKTRVLDAKATGGPEIAHMRERWAELQNRALERAQVAERVDHRTLAVQREEALALGQEARADNLDRAPEVKLGPVVSGIERREERAAEREGRAYVPLTERGAQVHEARAARSLLAELGRVREVLREEVRQRAEAARETYAQARERGTDHVRAGLAALRAAAQRQGIGQGHAQGRGQEHELAHEAGHGREALDRVLGRGRGEERGHGQGRDPSQEQEAREASRAGIRERLGQVMGREALRHAPEGPRHGPQHQERERRQLGREAIRERLEALHERARPATEQRAGPAPGPVAEHGTGSVASRPAEPRGRPERDDVAERLRAHREGMERAREVMAEAERHLREQSIPVSEGVAEPRGARQRLEAALDRARPAATLGQEGHGSVVAGVLERARDEPAWAASFRTPSEAQAFREEMERRFTPDTLARLNQGEAHAVAEVGGEGGRLDGLCLARAWLDAQGEAERSPARMRVAYGLVDARHEAKREREGHEQGLSWGL